jgi:protocatechuate 3,4-dioxygenase beta subunit
MLVRFAKLCVLFLLVSIGLSAQEAPSTQTAKTPSNQTCRISGLVVKSGTSEPLKKAHIYLRKEDDPMSGYTTHTDAAGHFAIEKIDPGRYDLRVGHTGYVSQSYGENSSTSRGAVLALNPGREIRDLLFRMVPWAVISGKVTDEDGDPVSDAQVQAMRHSVKEGKRVLEPRSVASTNDLGEFRLYGLAKGRYFIHAVVGSRWDSGLLDSSVGDAGSTSRAGYAPVYYPGTADEARAATIEVAPGQEVSAIDFMLLPIRTFRVRGHVFDAVLGQPAKDCFIFLVRHDPGESNSFYNQQSGTNCVKGAFQLSDVPPGSYYILANSWNVGKQRAARAVIDVNNTNLDDVSLTFAPGIALTGHILVEGHEILDFSEVNVRLDDPEQYFGGEAGAAVKPNGTLTVENLTEGNYQIGVGGRPAGFSPDFYLKAARVNGEDVLERGLTIGAGSTRGPLEIVLSSAGARIEGTVTDENDLPFAGAVVAIVPERDRRKQFRLFKDTTTDQYGQFILRGVAPGTYKLFSWKEVEDNAWEDPEFLAPFETQGTGVTAEENGHITIRLKLIPTEKPK